MMSKRNYVIGAREPIGGDRSPRRYRNTSDEYPLPVVRRNGVGKSSEKNRSETKRKEAIVTHPTQIPKWQAFLNSRMKIFTFPHSRRSVGTGRHGARVSNQS